MLDDHGPAGRRTVSPTRTTTAATLPPRRGCSICLGCTVQECRGSLFSGRRAQSSPGWVGVRLEVAGVRLVVRVDPGARARIRRWLEP